MQSGQHQDQPQQRGVVGPGEARAEVRKALCASVTREMLVACVLLAAVGGPGDEWMG